MPVAIEEVDLEVAPPSAAPAAQEPRGAPPPPDPRELEHWLEVHADRLARVRAH